MRDKKIHKTHSRWQSCNQVNKAQHLHKKVTRAKLGKKKLRTRGNSLMSPATRRSLQIAERPRTSFRSNGNGHGGAASNGHGNGANAGNSTNGNGASRHPAKPCVFVAAENRLLREALSRMLTKNGDIEVITCEGAEPFPKEAQIAARDSFPKDGLVAQASPETSAASCRNPPTHAKEIWTRTCPQFDKFARQAPSCSASVHQRLGLTRREQQLIPLVAEGLTNKEIANRFCLSEQTVKNHLYRMKQKIGAGDRLGIVQVCRTKGFMV